MQKCPQCGASVPVVATECLQCGTAVDDANGEGGGAEQGIGSENTAPRDESELPSLGGDADSADPDATPVPENPPDPSLSQRTAVADGGHAAAVDKMARPDAAVTSSMGEASPSEADDDSTSDADGDSGGALLGGTAYMQRGADSDADVSRSDSASGDASPASPEVPTQPTAPDGDEVEQTPTDELSDPSDQLFGRIDEPAPDAVDAGLDQLAPSLDDESSEEHLESPPASEPPASAPTDEAPARDDEAPRAERNDEAVDDASGTEPNEDAADGAARAEQHDEAADRIPDPVQHDEAADDAPRAETNDETVDEPPEAGQTDDRETDEESGDAPEDDADDADDGDDDSDLFVQDAVHHTETDDEDLTETDSDLFIQDAARQMDVGNQGAGDESLDHTGVDPIELGDGAADEEETDDRSADAAGGGPTGTDDEPDQNPAAEDENVPDVDSGADDASDDVVIDDVISDEPDEEPDREPTAEPAASFETESTPEPNPLRNGLGLASGVAFTLALAIQAATAGLAAGWAGLAMVVGAGVFAPITFVVAPSDLSPATKRALYLVSGLLVGGAAGATLYIAPEAVPIGPALGIGGAVVALIAGMIP